MNVLIINLTRFGDLLQTQAVVSGFKEQGHEVTLLCLDNFSKAASLLRHVDRVCPLPGGRLLARLDQDWTKAVQVMWEEVRQVRSPSVPDLCINLTPSLSARLLAKEVGVPNTLGFRVDDDGFNADSSMWCAFLQMASAERGASPFNVVDLFRKVAGLGGPGAWAPLADPASDAMEAMRGRMERTAPGSAGFFGLQLGASEDRRRYPVELFAQAAQEVAEKTGRAPVLFGTDAEAQLAGRFEAAFGGPCVNLCGSTGLVELAAALRCVGVLMTNDTGTMHLAAGLGVPVVAVFLATAQPFDTGPCQEGAVSLEPDMDCHPCRFKAECLHDHACRRAIPPQAVARAALDRLGHLVDWEDIAGARVWRTGLDDEGMWVLSPVARADGDRARWIGIQRALYRRFLDGLEPSLPPGLPAPSAQWAAPVAEVLEQVLSILFLIIRQGELLARGPGGPTQAKLLANWKKVQALLESRPETVVLGRLWRFESEQMATNLAGLMSVASRHRALAQAALAAILP